METQQVHISQITIGDTIIRREDGNMCTVGKGNIKIGGFCGRTIWGDSWDRGSVLVERVIFKRHSF